MRTRSEMDLGCIRLFAGNQNCSGSKCDPLLQQPSEDQVVDDRSDEFSSVLHNIDVVLAP